MPSVSPDPDTKILMTEPELPSPEIIMLRASIQAARARVRNHPSVRRLVMPDPVTGGSYNPNQIPFEISEKEEENYLEDSWDFRQRQDGFKRQFGFAVNTDLKVEEEDGKIEGDLSVDEVNDEVETVTSEPKKESDDGSSTKS
jgi:hypothetical protein